MQELHKQMERFRSEQMQLETRITELLPYQSEVAKLKGDLVKMQVRKSSPGGVNGENGLGWLTGVGCQQKRGRWLTTSCCCVVTAD